MEAPDITHTPPVLLTLEELDDHDLHTVIVWAQSLLLDRPAPRDDAFTVEIADGQERHLLDQARQLVRAQGPQGRNRSWPDRTAVDTSKGGEDTWAR